MTSRTPAPEADGDEAAQAGRSASSEMSASQETSAPSEQPEQPEQPEQESAGARPAAASRPGRRGAYRALAVALLGGAVGAALALIASGQTWSESTASFAQGTVPVHASGGDVTGLPSALALVGLAALVAVFAVRRAGRLVVAGLLTLCGAGVVASALAGSRDTAALTEEAAKTSGLADSGIGTLDVTAWPYLSAAGGLLLVLAGVLALRYARVWPSMSGSARYERTPLRQRAARQQRIDPDRPEDLWKALDRGEDPTTGTA
nr:TIGR02234 family membrane protein [Streptomyces sp. NHF165]